MAEKISPDALYGRIYAEIQRRSDTQEKTVRLNIVVLTTLFGWVLTGLYFHHTIYLIAALVNLTFALKWLSEDRNIANLTNYLLDNSDAPLEKWQRDNFDSLYPWWLKCGDFLWRVAIFLAPSIASTSLLLYHLHWTNKSIPVAVLLNIGMVFSYVLLLLVFRGFVFLYFRWPKNDR